MLARWRRVLVFNVLFLASAAVGAQTMRVADIADLSIEELGNIQITSVSRHAERLSDAPAAIFVITGEDIRRSGATRLPEALRLAPNLEVARSSASSYAISARGFNNTIANKLLVLIDGRTVYTPLFSGVFWDAQDVMLEDVERIEVISGPGATLWGANAVNGVINVITRRASDTQGAFAYGRAAASNAAWARATAARWARSGRTASTAGFSTSSTPPEPAAPRRATAGARAGRLSHRLGDRRERIHAAGRRLPGLARPGDRRRFEHLRKQPARPLEPRPR